MLPLNKWQSDFQAARVSDRWQSVCGSETSFKTNGCLTLLTTPSRDCQRLPVRHSHPRKLSQLALRGDDIYQQHQSLQACKCCTKCADTKHDTTDILGRQLRINSRQWKDASKPGTCGYDSVHCDGLKHWPWTPSDFLVPLVLHSLLNHSDHSCLSYRRWGWGGVGRSPFSRVKREKRGRTL